MRYVIVQVDPGDGRTWLDAGPYLEVRDELAEQLPDGARAYALDDDHYAFGTGRCVKNLGFGSLNLAADSEGELSVTLELLPSPWHHRSGLTIHYTGVWDLHLDKDFGEDLGRLHLDEVLPDPHGACHELLFVGGVVTLRCHDLRAQWGPDEWTPDPMMARLKDLEKPWDPTTPTDYDVVALIAYGLGRYDYWVSRALAWLEAGAPATGLVNRVEEMSRDRSFSQQVRNQARRVVKAHRPHPWTAWALSPGLRKAAEVSLERLVGKTIVGCRYVGVTPVPGEPHWQQPTHDELGYGLELDLDDGSTWSVIWEISALGEGLNIHPDRMYPDTFVPDASISTWDVSERWLAQRLGAISRVELDWQTVETPAGSSYQKQAGGLLGPAYACLASVELVGKNDRSATISQFKDAVRVHFQSASAVGVGSSLAPTV